MLFLFTFTSIRDLDGRLNYWKDHKRRFPKFSMMGCDLSTILVTTLASKSSLSIGPWNLNEY
ncbi:HAT, C-terminal dimerization domain [Dillenia turbinata]|uniref:HAT, C-terminal dimerization domain n=1 Tax=Dillenia turbinata TaxID=194707 RepID=A0AAN8VU27_9MAGN